MNDPHFTGRIVKTKLHCYTNREGETIQQLILHLQTDEAKPQRLILRLSPAMSAQLQALQPQQHRIVITAYLYFRQFEYQTADEVREGQEVCAWKLEGTVEDTQQIFTIDRTS